MVENTSGENTFNENSINENSVDENTTCVSGWRNSCVSTCVSGWRNSCVSDCGLMSLSFLGWSAAVVLHVCVAAAFPYHVSYPVVSSRPVAADGVRQGLRDGCLRCVL